MRIASTVSAVPRRPGSSGFRAARRRPVRLVSVDDTLAWVVPRPELEPGSTSAPSADALLRLSMQFDDCLSLAHHAVLSAELLDAAARIIGLHLSDLPDLPLVGEPFGGEEGTD